MTGNIDLEAAFDRVFKGFYEEVLKNRAADAEQMARDNAPWKDQTGDARKLLRGEAFLNGDEMGITLAHGVEYGTYLETANNGKHAILKPTLARIAPEIKAAAIDAFRKR